MNIFGKHIHFEHPEFLAWSWLAVLLVALVLVFGYINLLVLRRSYADEAHLKRTAPKPGLAFLVAKALSYGLATFLLMVALAEPYEPNRPTVVPAGSIHLVAAFDVSNSMGAEDYRDALPTEKLPDGTPIKPVGYWGTRLQVAFVVFTEQVMQALPGNQIGLATYTADPWPVSPLNRDYSTLRRMMKTGWVRIGGAPGGGSDYVQGIRASVETLREGYDPKVRNIILLFSDGGLGLETDAEKEEWAKEYQAAIAEVKALKAELVVVGLGSKQPQMVPVYNSETGERLDWFPVGAPEDKKETTAIDEDALKKLVADAGGTYVYLDPTKPASLGVDWVNAIGGKRVTLGKLYLGGIPLLAAMGVLVLVLSRGAVQRPTNQPVSRYGARRHV